MNSRLVMSFAALLLAAGPAIAQGAVAIGKPADVARDGIAAGLVVNADTEEAARAGALEQCTTFPDAKVETRALCKIVQTFRDACVAVSIDPEAGTDGFGYSVSPNRQTAESEALAACKASAGPERAGFCVIGAVECDGDAQ